MIETIHLLRMNRGNTRDQLSTVYETLIPRGFLGWGNVSSLGFSFPAVTAAKLAHPDRQCVAVIGDAALSYMLGNFEVLTRLQIGLTIVHIKTVVSQATVRGSGARDTPLFTFDVFGARGNKHVRRNKGNWWKTKRVTEPSEVALLRKSFSC
ncbi:MAG: hypothetical protein Ct9H300mP19_11470 [Dehalococcoidia bacterium]|nr:MAG: hypothetical protein Ct9H300mP19_11470 [Dehalococcoidia bacterium]